MLFIRSLIASSVPLVTPGGSLSALWSPRSCWSPLKVAFPDLESSLKDGAKGKFVCSTLVLRGLASFSVFVCTGDNGAALGEEKVMEAGGGVANGTLEGVRPAAAFLSIWANPSLI
uniref:Uncharacterized protein n=1 Tax=Opuntia streptacantha TaxID=393608 RepID=A0A7C8YMG7_OPUST